MEAEDRIDLYKEEDVVVVAQVFEQITTARESESQTQGIPNFTADQWMSQANFLNSQKQSTIEKLSG